MKKIPYLAERHGDFDSEWLPHRGISEWWYATGYVQDDDGRLFSYQFTLILPYLSGLRPMIFMGAVTDFQSSTHYYHQKVTLKKNSLLIDGYRVQWGAHVSLSKDQNNMLLKIRESDYALTLNLAIAKPAVWHGRGGVLQMGLSGRRQTTTYYSYTNLPTVGSLDIGGHHFDVTGKSWFDKQGGPYAITHPKTHWEWFSFRFFDDEEIMLFSFPQDKKQDGTYIRQDGTASRLTHYAITAKEFTFPDPKTMYSCLWHVSLPGIKEEDYDIVPLLKGQMNLNYYELLASIRNAQGQEVGYCFVELLPGARNKHISVRSLRQKQVEKISGPAVAKTI